MLILVDKATQPDAAVGGPLASRLSRLRERDEWAAKRATN
jgi:hypothetical protein